MNYKLSTKGNKVEISLDKTEYSVSLARTGGQGSKGDTITNVYFDENKNLLVEVTNSSGEVTIINAGSVIENFQLSDLIDVVITDVKDGDYLAYDAATQTYKNYQLTTTRLSDVDNSARQDGSVLVYNSTSSKYVATNQLNNPNTLIVGGNF